MNLAQVWPFSIFIERRETEARNQRTTNMLNVLSEQAEKSRRAAIDAAEQTITKYHDQGDTFAQLERIERTLLNHDKG